MEMKKLIESILEWLRQGEDIALATIIANSGSTPREAGARMAVRRDGVFSGTIGGGAVEYRTQQVAQEILREKRSKILHFDLSPNETADLGMICGGNLTVYMQYISSANEAAKELFLYATEMFKKNKDSWLVTDITDENNWRMSIYTKQPCKRNCVLDAPDAPAMLTNRAVQVEISGRRYYFEPLTRAGKVFVFGGGHISQELVPLLSHLGFRCVVFDDLDKFANSTLFPAADEIVVGNFDDISASVKITEDDYVVIMTRGHCSDYAVQLQAMRLNPCYIGVIGSRKKIASISQRLLEQGVSQAAIDSVHTPIGLAIEAQTPAEIAISIAAELIMVRARRELTFI